jgi:hypothetical protein
MANKAVFDGYCPESKLHGIIAEMQLNEDDFWESTETGLQITTFPPFAAILSWRGKGKFKIHVQNASEHHFKLILTRASKDPGKEIFPDKNGYFTSVDEFSAYLQSIK